MKRQLVILVIVSILSNSCKSSLNKNVSKIAILKIEMYLSAFGVESDNFPSAKAYIDFKMDSSYCEKTYSYLPYKNSNYKLLSTEIKKVLDLLQSSDLHKLKSEYKVYQTDMPTSTIVIYTQKQTIKINDYGLAGDYPLQDIYKIVYKL